MVSIIQRFPTAPKDIFEDLEEKRKEKQKLFTCESDTALTDVSKNIYKINEGLELDSTS